MPVESVASGTVQVCDGVCHTALNDDACEGQRGERGDGEYDPAGDPGEVVRKPRSRASPESPRGASWPPAEHEEVSTLEEVEHRGCGSARPSFCSAFDGTGFHERLNARGMFMGVLHEGLEHFAQFLNARHGGCVRAKRGSAGLPRRSDRKAADLAPNPARGEPTDGAWGEGVPEVRRPASARPAPHDGVRVAVRAEEPISASCLELTRQSHEADRSAHDGGEGNPRGREQEE